MTTTTAIPGSERKVSALRAASITSGRRELARSELSGVLVLSSVVVWTHTHIPAASVASRAAQIHSRRLFALTQVSTARRRSLPPRLAETAARRGVGSSEDSGRAGGGATVVERPLLAQSPSTTHRATAWAGEFSVLSVAERKATARARPTRSGLSLLGAEAMAIPIAAMIASSTSPP